MRGSRQKRRIFAKEFFLIWSGLTVAGLAIFCAFTVFFSVPKERVATTISTSTPAVFLFPHQDDEMFLGGEILRQLQSGRPVYAVMVTDGAASRARFIINGEDEKHRPVIDGLVHRIRKPEREGYRPLDKRAFTEARNKEFYASMRAFGIPADHIIFANPGGVAASEQPLYRNDELTIAEAGQVVQMVFNQIGNGTYITLAAKRGKLIAEKLAQLGITDTWSEVLALAEGDENRVGRAHFAQCLLNRGIVNNLQKAFDKYLATGKPAAVPMPSRPGPRSCAHCRPGSRRAESAHSRAWPPPLWRSRPRAPR
jgi:hypothetical protein